jgi:tRNA-splicing ligase RtcB
MPEHLDKKLISWASILEDNTREQAIKTASMPFIYPHLALMPDAHLGKGATVGSVIPTQGAIIPAAVGVDIGCGMMAIRTQFKALDLPTDRSELRQQIEDSIPLSAGKFNQQPYDDETKASIHDLRELAEGGDERGDWGFNPADYLGGWGMQLGTLGSGNHFIEVTMDEEDRVWLFLHSGSRGVGNKIAQRNIKIAAEYCRRHFIALPDPDLAYLIEGTEPFDRYIFEMQWAQEFAFQNRQEMMRRLHHAFEFWVGEEVAPELEVNCHHNYTTRERHFGQNVWLSRKGAIDASQGTWGLIPGSMGTASYVVEGKGNVLALNSAPHGAGRVHSRSSARKTFTHEELQKAMVGIEWRDSSAFLDEIPSAYKDIDVVMADAAELVEVKHTLRQLINVKGE